MKKTLFLLTASVIVTSICIAAGDSGFDSIKFKRIAVEPAPLSYAQLSQAHDSILAYASAVDRVAKYQEPVASRGTTGMAVFRKAAPSVTLVVVYNNNQGNLDPEGLGTGVVVNSSGYILTNWHVVGQHQVAVVFLKPPTDAELNNNYAYVGDVVYVNPLADLALLKLRRPPGVLPILEVGNLSDIQVAEDIHVIGHPHGNLWSYGTGVISQIRNDFAWSYSDGSHHTARVLQMQTAINPGNSGGPVLDDNSRVLGLVAMSEEGQNLDYAIAADVIQRFLLQGYAAARTRGSTQTRSSESIKAETFVGRTAQGEEVTKFVYPPFLTFWVKRDNKFNRLVLLDNAGNRIIATPDDSGQFRNWQAMLSNGHTIGGEGNGDIPEILTVSHR